MIHLENQYTPNINAADGNYTYGSFRNDTSASATDGTPLEQAFLNDVNGFFQSVMVEAGIVPSGNVENINTSQIKEAIRTIINARINALVPAASQTTQGKAEIATQTEVNAGSDNSRIVTPAGLHNRVASTTLRGIVELATNTEVINGTDTSRASTPAGVKAAIDNRVASSTAKGIVELATSAETLTGTDGSRAVTPDSLHDAFVGTQSGNGAAVLPGGIRLAWGSVSATAISGTSTIRQLSGSFATAFPGSAFKIFLQCEDQFMYAFPDALTTTGFTGRVEHVNPGGAVSLGTVVNYFVIGN